MAQGHNSGYNVKITILNLFLLLLITALIVGAGLYFNRIVSYIHRLELQAYLIRYDREESWNDYIRMVSKYKLYREIYTTRGFHKELTRRELEVALVLVQDDDRKILQKEKKYGFILPVVIKMTNLFRAYLDNPPLEEVFSVPSLPYYYVGLYLEKNNYYDQAITFFEKSLDFRDSNDELILLHLGYCYSIIGKYDQARAFYSQVMQLSENHTIRTTCSVLLNYLNFFQGEMEQVKKKTPEGLEAYEVFFQLLAFNEALNELKKRERERERENDGVNGVEDVEKGTNRTKEQFYKALCLEELGKKEEALAIYQNLISEDYTTEFAREANRRILYMGLGENRTVLIKLSRNNNKLIGDSELTSLYEMSSLLPEAERLADIIEKYPVTIEFVDDVLKTEEKRQKAFNKMVTAVLAKSVKKNENTKETKESKEGETGTNEKTGEPWGSRKIHSFSPEEDGTVKPVIYVTAGENHIVGLTETGVAGFNKRGSLIWNRKYGVAERISFMTSPVIKQGKVYLVSANRKLVILNLATGRETGRIDLPGGVTYGFPCQILGEKLLVPGITGIFLYDFNKRTAEMLEYVDLRSPTSPLLLDKNIIVSSLVEQKVVSFSEDGFLEWTYILENRSFQSPFLTGGSVFIGDTRGLLYKISPDKGNLESSRQLPAGITGRFVSTGNTFTVLLNNGGLYKIYPENLSYTKIVQVDRIPDPTSYLFKYPVVLGQNMFIGTDSGKVLVLDKNGNKLISSVELSSTAPVTAGIGEMNGTYFTGNKNGDIFLFFKN